MPRKPREYFEGAVYHAMSRGNAKQAIFLDDADYRRFLKIISDLNQVLDFELYAYCLMPNHFHLLIRLGLIPLDQIMQQLLTRYALGFNRKWNRVGHVFQGRYPALLCTTDTYFLQLVRYIHLNPVKANLAASPDDWPWSSHRQYLEFSDGIASIDYPMSLFGQEPAAARSAYLELLAQGPISFPPHPEENKIPPERKLVRPTSPRPTLGQLRSTACDSVRISPAMFMSQARNRAMTSARRWFILEALAVGYKVGEIARCVNRSPSAVSRCLTLSATPDTVLPSE